MYWKVLVGLKCVRYESRRVVSKSFPLKMVRSRKSMEKSEMVYSYLMVGWNWLRLLKKVSKSSLG